MNLIMEPDTTATTKTTETTWSQTELEHIAKESGITIFGQSNTSLEEVKRLRSELHQYDLRLKVREAQQRERQRRTTTGKVKIVYERYDDLFELSNGTINIGTVDQEYCLSDLFAKCEICRSHGPPSSTCNVCMLQRTSTLRAYSTQSQL